MEVDLGLADEAIRELEAQGFHLVKSGGPLGRENLTFQNEAGEVVEAHIEWKSAKPRNMKFYLRNDVRHFDNQRDYLQPPTREICERIYRPSQQLSSRRVCQIPLWNRHQGGKNNDGLVR